MTSGRSTAVSGDRAAARLARPNRASGLPQPGYAGRSLPNITSSIFRTLVPRARTDGLAPPLAPALDPFDGRAVEGPIVLLLVDGLGWEGLRGWAARSSTGLGPRWRAHASPITTVFPSTTTAALLSLSTATPPGRHGFVGYRQFLPRFGVVADMLRMSAASAPGRDTLVGPEWSPEHVSGVPTVFRRGLRAAALSRESFRSSGFTRVLYDGAEFVGYGTATDMARSLSQILRRSRPPPAVFVYWDELDTIQHLHGPDPKWITLELDQLSRLLAQVFDALPAALRRRSWLVATGDHGQVATDRSARIPVDRLPDVLAEMAWPIAGDRRGTFFAARPGRRAALERALRRHLPPRARIVSVERAIRAGLFGPRPHHPELRDRLGDLLVLAPSPAALTYQVPGAAPPTRFLLGGHGGLEADELIVPLIAGPLDRFGSVG
ncbi:MAG TPA: alkaline phosphatase family protein [Thermoplasmata archaeon]|nr:alkaline phosphatase family protein [Thermoplasmata archaeon]